MKNLLPRVNGCKLAEIDDIMFELDKQIKKHNKAKRRLKSLHYPYTEIELKITDQNLYNHWLTARLKIARLK